MKVTYLGTTMLLFDDGKDQLLFDCHVTRPSYLKVFTGKLATDREVADRVIKEFNIDRLKGMFISHSHYDHVLDAAYFAEKCQTSIYGSPSTMNVARGGGIAEENLHSYTDSMEYQVGEYHVQVIPSIHSKAHWYNNDLGQTIDTPLPQPAGKKSYKEGGSFDFLLTHRGKQYLIRPSYNYLEGQLDGIHADVLFLGISGLSKDTEENKTRFFTETVDKVTPKIIIPVHWDNFFTPLYGEVKNMPFFIEDTNKSMRILKAYCKEKQIRCVIQRPRSCVKL